MYRLLLHTAAAFRAELLDNVVSKNYISSHEDRRST